MEVSIFDVSGLRIVGYINFNNTIIIFKVIEFTCDTSINGE